ILGWAYETDANAGIVTAETALSQVPEPATEFLMGLGLLALGAAGIRAKRRNTTQGNGSELKRKPVPRMTSLEPLANKVLLVGWNAADWRVIDPLIAQGKMPNLAAFLNNGVRGNISTLNPPLSPMLWTSIATGKRPYKHGIHGFAEPTPDGRGVRPITNLSRRTKALWNILHQSGKTSNVVGWWPSHPAEPIRGVMVSNHYHRAHRPLDQPWPMALGTVHPPRLAKPLEEFRLHPAELDGSHIAPFGPRFGEVDQ